MNIVAFFLPIIIFLFWGMVGYSALSLLRTQRNIIQNLLLAPTVGIAITLLPIFWLNRAGIPVGNFATALTIILFLISIVIFFWKKPFFPIRYYLPFAAIIIFALWLTGRPLLDFGFNWVSYANDDMANYCLGALRFLQHGYFDVPEDISSYREYSLNYWFVHVANMIRSGSELLLAWLSGLVHLTPLQIFMPLIMVFHLTLISAGTALVYQNRSLRNAAIITCFLLACSPLNSLGTLCQLIAQVVGISLLITSTILLLQPFTLHHKYVVCKQSILISIIIATLLICYPEVVPFLSLSMIAYFSLNLIQGWKPRRNFWLTIILCILCLLVFLNKYWVNFFVFLEFQSTMGMSSFKAELFPYFLLPSGLANLWGIFPIAVPVKEPWQSIAIMVSLLLLCLTAVMAIKYIFKKQIQPIIVMLLVMLSLSVLLFKQNSGFGLFKIAMYVQPFLICTIVLLVFCIFKNNIYKAFLLLFSILLLTTQYHYLKYSYGEIGTPFNELANASKTNLLEEINILSKSIPNNKNLFVDVHSYVPAKLLALYFTGKTMHFYSSNFFDTTTGINKFSYSYRYFMEFNSSINDTANKMMNIMANNYVESNFLIKYSSLQNNFKSLKSVANDTIAIIATPNRSILNHREFREPLIRNFVALPQSKLSNHLVFIKSKLGQDYYHGESNYISIRNFENDYFYKSKGVVGLGQYLLFQIINPSQNIRAELNITKTNSQDRNSLLPSAMIIGENAKAFPIVGRGSARVFSPPINPQIIAGSPYIMLDMGEKGKSFKGERSGLMKLYGTQINLDIRLITAYARDISLISENDYENLLPPSYLSNFPADLANPDLEYSGIYEDGWLSEAAFFNLLQPNKKSHLVIKGLLPKIDKPITIDLTIYLDGKKIALQQISEGYFDIQIPVSQNSGRRKIELRFGKTQVLPHGDNRSVAGKIDFIGFKEIA